MKIWFYYARSGGGHRAPAKAIADEMKKIVMGDIEAIQVDLAERSTVFYRFLLEQFYIFLTQRTPSIYSLIYKMSQNEKIISFEYWLAEKTLKFSLKRRFLAERPSAVVATHFLISPLRAIFRELNVLVPIVVVVTEPFSAPKVWFHYKDLDYIVFSESARDAGLSVGVPAENLHLFSQVVSQPILNLSLKQKEMLKKEYGLDPLFKTVLIMGGANGLPRGIKMIEALLKKNIEAKEKLQFITVCGTNKKMAKRAEKLAKKYSDQKFLVVRWTDKLSELVSVSDLVVAKAGAGVVWETLLHHKPLMLTHYIYGQEFGTMEYVVNNKLGWYEPSISVAADRVFECITDQKIMDSVAQRHEEMRLGSGNREVGRFLVAKLMEERVVPKQPVLMGKGNGT